MISEETRAEAYKMLDENERERQVLECLGDKEMTVREVVAEMLRREYIEEKDKNYVAPRMTTLFQRRELVIVAKKREEKTGRNVAVYRRRELLERDEEDDMNHIPRID